MGIRAMATASFYHDGNPRLAYIVSIRLLAEMRKHIQVGLIDDRDDIHIETQGIGHICD